jgi:hypothetical protein
MQEIVTAVNQLAEGRPIGHLPKWRREHKKRSRLPGTLFFKSVKDGREYVFHVGGRNEFQFNLGFESFKVLKGRASVNQKLFRQGVAFSLEPSRTLPDVTVLYPKIERFNEFMRIYPDVFPDFRMWYWRGGVRSSEYPLAPIPDEIAKTGTFIFMGKSQQTDTIAVSSILDDLDRLFPLYQFVEGTESFPFGTQDQKDKPFSWPSSNETTTYASSTSYQKPQKTVEVSLRHNSIQDALFGHLRKVHGAGNTTRELPATDGTRIDTAVRDGEMLTYYEIKVYSSARACIREALGQLLEYSHWPRAQKADRLVVVGEAPFDDGARSYINSLKQAFSMPLEYMQFDMKKRCLVKGD